jgi:hypothetical protein
MTNEERIGKAVVRVQSNKDGGFSGVVIRDGKRSDVLHDDDEQRLWARLRNEAGTLEPNYHGIDDAIARFLSFMPGGFEGERNLDQERQYKRTASRKLNEILTPELALKSDLINATAVRRAGEIWINLLSPYESMHLKAALESPSGAQFLRAAAKFAAGEYEAGAAGMKSAIGSHGRLTWPIATYFPFLWDPENHMFLKPTVTCDFAERVGHSFQYAYTSEIEGSVYSSLLELADWTAAKIKDLKPRDRIDVQSFIYVVGGYREDDKPE